MFRLSIAIFHCFIIDFFSLSSPCSRFSFLFFSGHSSAKMAMPILVCLGTTAVLELRRMAMRGEEGKALDELRASEQKLTKLVQVWVALQREGRETAERWRERGCTSLRVSSQKRSGLRGPLGRGNGANLRLAELFTPTKKMSLAAAAVEERNSNGSEEEPSGFPAFLSPRPVLAASNSSRVAESSL